MKIIYDFHRYLLINKIIVFGCTAALIIIVIYYIYNLLKNPDKVTLTDYSDGSTTLKFFAIVFFCFIFTVVVLFKFFELLNVIKIDKNKEYHIVEGYVENYHPRPKSGKGNETFVVNGVSFSNGDDETHYGYTQSALYGGVIKEGLYVRITYIHEEMPNENAILKLEIK